MMRYKRKDFSKFQVCAFSLNFGYLSKCGFAQIYSRLIMQRPCPEVPLPENIVQPSETLSGCLVATYYLYDANTHSFTLLLIYKCLARNLEVSISVFDLHAMLHHEPKAPKEGRDLFEKLSTYVNFMPLMFYEERNSPGRLLCFRSQTFLTSRENHRKLRQTLESPPKTMKQAKWTTGTRKGK